MAKNGEDRPSGESSTGDRLIRCTNLKSSSYDAEFDKQIREIRPDWFITKFDVANQKKQKLLEMARSGEDKPNYKNHILGRILYGYCYPTSSSYDAEFDKQIRELRPDWFITQFDVANQKKQKLLEMARSGEDRPSGKKHTLGKAVCYYCCPTSGSYDAEFDKQIRELRPDWFITRFDVANQKKQKLLEMARNGEDKPRQRKHQLSMVFQHYTNHNNKCYDSKFTEEIKELRPDWF